MNLRLRILLIACIALVVLIGGFYAISSTLLMNGFLRVEEGHMQRNMGRTAKALESEVRLLDTTAGDWANWDDSYEFIQSVNPAYIRSNLEMQSFEDLGVNFIIFLSKTGNVVYAKGVDLETKQEIPVPPEVHSQVKEGSPLLAHKSNYDSKTGLLMLPEHPMIVASRPVTTNDRTATALGVVIFGRYLDSKVVGRIGENSHVAVSLFRLDDDDLPGDVSAANQRLGTDTPVVLDRLDGNAIAGYSLLSDVDGEPALILRAMNDRAIHAQGLATIRTLMLSMLIVGLGIGILAVVLLDRIVISRLKRVAADVDHIGACDDLSARVSVDGDDELASLATTINRTLEALETSRTALAANERRHQLVLDAMSEAVWDRNLRTRSFYFSPQWLHSLEYSPSDVENTASFLRSVVHPDDSERVRQATRAHIEERTAGYECEVRLRVKSGRWRWHLERGKVVEWDADGNALRLLGTHRDITEKRRLEQQFFQAQKMEAVGQLAGGIAHDFNNLLTVIVGQAASIRREIPSGSDLQWRAEEICEASTKAASLTRQLLAFSRNQTLKPRVIDIRKVVGDIESMLCRILGEDIVLKSTHTPQPAWVKADVSQIEQVLVNMALNTRDAMSGGGQFGIEIGETFIAVGDPLAEELPPGDYVVVGVSDSGPGMSESVRSRIFEPFFTTKPTGKGTGLGLASCYGIVKQSGGHITVSSEQGRGSCFSIYLPVADVPSEDSRPADAPAPQLVGGAENIIVVEDEPSVREITVEVLRSCGYEVVEATDGLEAQKVLEDLGIHRIDLVVTDVMMPNMDGKEFHDWFMEKRPDGRVLFISGYTSDAFGPDGEGERSVELLEKPFMPSVLAKKVREMLDRPIPTERRG